MKPNGCGAFLLIETKNLNPKESILYTKHLKNYGNYNLDIQPRVEEFQKEFLEQIEQDNVNKAEFNLFSLIMNPNPPRSPYGYTKDAIRKGTKRNQIPQSADNQSKSRNNETDGVGNFEISMQSTEINWYKYKIVRSPTPTPKFNLSNKDIKERLRYHFLIAYKNRPSSRDTTRKKNKGTKPNKY